MLLQHIQEEIFATLQFHHDAIMQLNSNLDEIMEVIKKDSRKTIN